MIESRALWRNCRITRKNKMENQNIIIYQNPDGNEVEIRVGEEALWLNLNQIAALFGKDKSTISRHIKNIFAEGELSENSVVAKNATTAADGKSYQVEYYNLDMVLSVGYRVNSKNATAFRIWATNVLKKYLTDGYAVDEKSVSEYKEKFKMLQQAVSILQRTAVDQIENLDPMMRRLLNVVSDFSGGFSVLDSYDHEGSEQKGRTAKEAVFISCDEFLADVRKAREQIRKQ
jgi:hypothetical protein